MCNEARIVGRLPDAVYFKVNASSSTAFEARRIEPRKLTDIRPFNFSRLFRLNVALVVIYEPASDQNGGSKYGRQENGNKLFHDALPGGSVKGERLVSVARVLDRSNVATSFDVN